MKKMRKGEKKKKDLKLSVAASVIFVVVVVGKRESVVVVPCFLVDSRAGLLSLSALWLNSDNSMCTQVAIIGFWEANVRCDELRLPPHPFLFAKGSRGVGEITCWRKI